MLLKSKYYCKVLQDGELFIVRPSFGSGRFGATFPETVNTYS